MNRKALAAILTGTMVLSATACSAGGDYNTASTTVANYNYAATEAVDGYIYNEPTEWEGKYPEETTVAGQDFNTEEYNTIKENSFIDVLQNPLSTFAADVDTGTYCNLRDMIINGYNLSNIASAIRTEEMVNYFDYKVDSKDDVFSVQYSVGDCPWNKDNKLLVMTMQANSETDITNEGNNFVFSRRWPSSARPSQ